MKLSIDEINILLSSIADRNENIRTRKRQFWPNDPNGTCFDKQLEKNVELYNRLLEERERLRLAGE